MRVMVARRAAMLALLLAWAPEAHGGSNRNKPGQEWGAGYVFSAPGCWDLRADRGSAYADVWIRGIKR
jgi:hypothetical protein